MTRHRRSQSSSAPTPRVSPIKRLWFELIRPALVIAAIGLAAVVYLYGCARLSVIECDLERLDRSIEQQHAVALDLQRQLAQLQTAERIQNHIAEHDLGQPRGTLQITLTDTPPELYAVLPSGDDDRDRKQIGLEDVASREQARLEGHSALLASAHSKW